MANSDERQTGLQEELVELRSKAHVPLRISANLVRLRKNMGGMKEQLRVAIGRTTSPDSRCVERYTTACVQRSLAA